MEKSSKKMNYENAAIIRDRIKALTQIQSSQKINTTNLNNADVISISQEAAKSCIQVFFYRSKQNWGNQSFFPTHDESHTAEEVLTSFIMQFYANKNGHIEETTCENITGNYFYCKLQQQVGGVSCLFDFRFGDLV